ncbi:MAG: hypothetical protein IT340_18475 [Chloroflexi bacterium]|nr:hypothetical protein [Chloroflexota bacterium]
MEVRVVRGAPRRRLGCCLGSFIALMVLVGVAGIVVPRLALGLMPGLGVERFLPASLSLEDILRPDGLLKSEFGIEQRPIPGDPHRFDPAAGLATAREFAGDGAELVAIRLGGVRSDGTLDLQASYRPTPDAEYRFARRLAQPPPNAPPVGAGGSASGVWYEPVVVRFSEPGQRRRVSATGGSAIDYITTGLDRRTEAPTATATALAPPPVCTAAALWQQARTRGAPADAVARIEYNRDGYTFIISGTPVNLRFGHDCQPRP